MYSDTRWGLQIHLCFINELGEILSYNRVSPGGIDHPRVRLIVWNKSLLDFWFRDRVFRLLILYCCEYSAKDVADWYRHNTMYHVCYIV